jgi:hypothetical protein
MFFQSTLLQLLGFKPIFYSLPLRSNNSTINKDINTEDANLGCDPISLGEWLN